MKNKIDVIIFCGQSNMQGQAERLSESAVVEGAYEYRLLTDTVKPLCNPVGETVRYDRTAGEDLSPDVPLRLVLKDWLAAHVVGASAYGYTNLVPEFCRAYHKATSREVLAVHGAKGSTEIEYWMPSGEAYAFLVDKTHAAIAKIKETHDIGKIYFVWLQGESDAIASRSREYYKESITVLCRSLKKDIGIEKFGIIRVGRFTGDLRDDEIISAQDEVCRENSDFLMLTEICEELPQMEGYMNPTVPGHYSAKGYEAIGRAAGEALGSYMVARCEKEKKKMRRTFSIAGWSVFASAVAVYLFSVFTGTLLGFVMRDDAQAFLNEHLLTLNQIVITVSLLSGAVVLAFLPKVKYTKSRLRVKELLCYICICFAIGWVGNIMGITWISFWNGLTENQVTNPLAESLVSVDALQMILCTGIAAPLIEEFIFRKLMIDRLRRFGDVAAIIVSAAFFAIFHQNFNQLFYAFGIGLLLGYVYCKTGRYRTVVLLHVIFNIFLGVMPTLLACDVQEFLLKLDPLMMATDHGLESFVDLVIESALPLIKYGVYVLIQNAINVTGVVLFCINVRKVRIRKSPLCIEARDQRHAAAINVGVILSMSLLAFLTLKTLFTA